MKSHNVILGPIMTEKSIAGQEQNLYQFWVRVSADKNQIRVAFKEVFEVKPIAVRTILLKGKSKRSKKNNRLTIGSTRKKAIIQVPEGSKMTLVVSPKNK